MGKMYSTLWSQFCLFYKCVCVCVCVYIYIYIYIYIYVCVCVCVCVCVYIYIYKMDFQEVGGGGDWKGLAQDRDRWRALVNTVMNFQVP